MTKRFGESVRFVFVLEFDKVYVSIPFFAGRFYFPPGQIGIFVLLVSLLWYLSLLDPLSSSNVSLGVSLK